MKVVSRVMWVLAVLLSDVMCAVVAYEFCELQWEIKTYVTSFPVETAFLYAIPFVIGIVICVVLALVFGRQRG